MRSTLNFASFTLIVVIAVVSWKKIDSDPNGAGNLVMDTLKKPPKSNAGLDQVIALPTDSVLLDDTNSSDPDGMISEWLWTKISGPASFNIN